MNPHPAAVMATTRHKKYKRITMGGNTLQQVAHTAGELLNFHPLRFLRLSRLFVAIP